MSVQILGSKEWNELFDSDTIACFLCGGMFQHSERVIHWMGTAGPKCSTLPFIPEDPTELKVVDALTKRGLWPALDIFLHVNCVPAFCRRILQDWEMATERRLKMVEGD